MPAPARRRNSGSPDLERGLRGGVIVVAALVLAVAAALLGTALTKGHTGSPATSAAGKPSRGAPPATGAGRSHAPSPSTPAPPPSPSPSISPTASTGGGSAGTTPQLAAVVPSAAGSGQSVTVQGSRLFSSDGHVQVSIGGQAAPTTCSDESSCSATVPALGGPARMVPVTVTTDAGTSNVLELTFTGAPAPPSPAATGPPPATAGPGGPGPTAGPGHRGHRLGDR